MTRSSWRSPAAEIETEARSGDVLYHHGGEEFLCIFPEPSLASGTLAVERMQRQLAGLQLSHSTSPNGVLTLSAGLVGLEARHGGLASAVLKEADEALYRAKRLGRNRIELALAQPA